MLLELDRMKRSLKCFPAMMLDADLSLIHKSGRS